jgi:hypothetical protein
MQQGRVALDADWNELVTLLDRRLRAETVDIIGRSVVPRETADGFAITIAGTGATKTLSIGRGRMYVHGLLAENHLPSTADFDLAAAKNDGSGPVGVLAELLGATPVSFGAQRYRPQRPGAPLTLPAGNGPHLVYLDVWQREVTHLEDETLLERALGGVDTTTRLQTVWQVKVLADVGNAVTCATPDAQIPGWPATIRPSGGRLSTRTVPAPPPVDPCLVPPQSGYRGLENQLYRVEIHTGGAPGTATFKWSRDNATVATRVVGLPAADEIEVERVGRDDVLRFNDGDWVEITDDVRELNGLPGAMLRITKVTDELRRIKLSGPVPADLVPTGAGNDTFARRHGRIRRWDQRGVVLDAAGATIVDLDASAAGVIPVPAAGTTFVVLEHGVQVAFEIAATGGVFHAMDHWTFAARTIEPPSLESLDRRPPAGIHHHYARLAVVTFPGTVQDCRVFWPPEAGGEACGCSVCVTAESHNGNTLTIQHAVDQVRASGGTVCLGVGIYNLGNTPIRIDGAVSVRVAGQGPAGTILVYGGNGPAVVVENSVGVTIADLAVLFPPRVVLGSGTFGGGPGFTLRNSAGVTIERCGAAQAGEASTSGTAIVLGRSLTGVTLADNVLFARNGVVGPDATDPDEQRYLLAINLVIRDNVIRCTGRGISLAGTTLHIGDTRIAGNIVVASTAGAIVALGAGIDPFRLDVVGNALLPAGPGVVVGTSRARVADNDIGPPSTTTDAVKTSLADAGIVLAEGLDPDGIDECQVFGNRVTDHPGPGLLIAVPVRRAMIKNNSITRAAIGGIVMDPDASAVDLVVENNQVTDIAPAFDSDTEPVAGLRFVHVDRLTVAGNSVGPVGGLSVKNPVRAAIDVLACGSVRVAGNDVVDVGPLQTLSGMTTAGIQVFLTTAALQVVDNRVRRTSLDPEPRAEGGDWVALFITDKDGFRQAPASLAMPLFLAAKTEFQALGRFRVRALAIPPSLEVTVRGNLLRSWGGSLPTMNIATGGARCVVDGNQCTLLRASKAPAVVRIAAPTVAVANNLVQREEKQDAIHILRDDRGFTVLGNITTGPILALGATGQLQPLDTPWKPLNILQA